MTEILHVLKNKSLVRSALQNPIPRWFRITTSSRGSVQKKVICTPTQKNYQEKKILKAIYNIYIIIHISKSCIFAQAWLISKILCSCHVCGSIYTANLNWNWTQKKHTYKKHVLCERNVTVIFYLFCMRNRIFSFVILIL